MENLNKLGLLCVVMALFAMAGCGKKHDSAKQTTKKVASTDIPVLKEETENLLDDQDISDFAFVDDEAAKPEEKSAVAFADESKQDESKVVASAEDDNLEVDDSALPDDENDATVAAYAFKAVHFDFNKNSIRADQKVAVHEDAEIAQEAVKQGKNVVIEGHCDQVGSASYNLALSQRRAEAIKNELVQAGINEENIKTVGYGYERPLVWSDAKDRANLIKELAPNRRAEILAD